MLRPIKHLHCLDVHVKVLVFRISQSLMLELHNRSGVVRTRAGIYFVLRNFTEVRSLNVKPSILLVKTTTALVLDLISF